MSVDPNSILALAEKLSQQDDEASHRSAISRSYYATYHEALALADQLALTPSKKSGVHDVLISRYAGSRRFAVWARSMQKMKLTRVRADYHLLEDIDVSEAKAMISSSRLLLDEMSKLKCKTTA